MRLEVISMSSEVHQHPAGCFNFLEGFFLGIICSFGLFVSPIFKGQDGTKMQS
jgi:hypothetical protein